MDREGFRNRLKQYKLAREENPGLKYWEWKLKYDSAPQPDSMPGKALSDLPTPVSQLSEDRAHRWDNGYVDTNREPFDSPYDDARYHDYRKPRFELRKGDVHYSNPNLLKWMGRFGKVLRGGSLLGETILNLFPSEEAELIEDLRVKMDKQNKWLTGLEDVPKYDEGGEVIGPPTESEWKRSLIKDDLWMHPDFYMAHSLEASKEALKQASAKLSGRDLMQEEELPIQRPVTEDFPYDWAIENLYDVENPYRKGIKNGVAKMYDNRTLGAGVDVKSGHPELYNRAKKYGLKLKEADDVAYEHIQHDADVIRNNYADIYGKAAADTLSLGPLFLLAQARYQLGNIKPAWDLAQKGLAEGNAEKITKATLSVTPKDHTHRINWVKNFKVYDNNPK